MSYGAWSFHAATSYAGRPAQPSSAGAEQRGSPIDLPEPSPLTAPLDAALARRASCRRFSGDALELPAVSSLLRAAYGSRANVAVEVEGTTFRPRAVPSAGATFPIEVHVLVRLVGGLEPGSYRYSPDAHTLERTGAGLPFESAADIFLGQPYLERAAALVILAGALMRTIARYGDRGYRYVLFEAGHAAQNLLLAAAALDLGSLALGGFLDETLDSVVTLAPGVVALYGVALGPPATVDLEEMRQP